MDLKHELASLLGANVPMVNLITYEEDRVIGTLGQLQKGGGLGIVAWDLADGFQVVRDGIPDLPAKVGPGMPGSGLHPSLSRLELPAPLGNQQVNLFGGTQSYSI